MFIAEPRINVYRSESRFVAREYGHVSVGYLIVGSCDDFFESARLRPSVRVGIFRTQRQLSFPHGIGKHELSCKQAVGVVVARS